MEEPSSAQKPGRRDADVRRPPVWKSHRRLVVRLGAVLIVIAAIIFAVDARRDHIERLERTHQMVSRATAQIESVFSSIEPLSSSELSELRKTRNKDHVAAAERLGIDGLTSVHEATTLSSRAELVRIANNGTYVIQELDYSVPYVVPSTATLLDKIGELFQQRLAERGLPRYKFVVTSVTRTREHQRALQRVNINAAKESSHEYGTTFDVHYGKFGYDGRPVAPGSADVYEDVLAEELSEAFIGFSHEYSDQLKALLGRVLIGLQDEGTALTIYERGQPVFHVTVARALSPTDVRPAP